MTMLIDRLMSGEAKFGVTETMIRLLGEDDTHSALDSITCQMSQATVFDIQNVTNYWRQRHGNGVFEFDDREEFPNIAPVEDSMWMESHWKTQRIGVLFTVLISDHTEPIRPEVVWNVEVWVFVEHYLSSSRILIAGPLVLRIDATGGLVGYSTSPAAQTYGLADDIMHGLMCPSMLTLSFLHCKNVTVERKPGMHATRQARREAQRRGDADPVSFHVLNIEPMKKVLATEGDVGHNGLKKALHICRGHFANYGEQYGKGKLFGKYEGQFWVPSHVRGDIDAGIADKDYAVKAPKGEQSW